MTEENKLYYDLLTEQCRINTDEIIENPPVAISMGETTINTIKGKTTIPTSLGTYGNFSFVVAPPKSFKTYFISLLASVYLSGKNRFAGNLRGHREKIYENNKSNFRNHFCNNTCFFCNRFSGKGNKLYGTGFCK